MPRYLYSFHELFNSMRLASILGFQAGSWGVGILILALASFSFVPMPVNFKSDPTGPKEEQEQPNVGAVPSTL